MTYRTDLFARGLTCTLLLGGAILAAMCTR